MDNAPVCIVISLIQTRNFNFEIKRNGFKRYGYPINPHDNELIMLIQ